MFADFCSRPASVLIPAAQNLYVLYVLFVLLRGGAFGGRRRTQPCPADWSRRRAARDGGTI